MPPVKPEALLPNTTPTYRPGDAVIHRRRGAGTVETVAINPLTRRPSKVVVLFPCYGGQPLRVVCWPEDVQHAARPVAPLPTSAVRPRLTVVPASPPSAA